MREFSSGIVRLVWWVLWVALIVYVVRHPGDAATIARGLVSGLGSAVESVVAFCRQVAGSAR
jgi:hypothetical protein